MPSRTIDEASLVATGKNTTSKRFQLPALDFQFESLTAGTDIPPPPPSPTRLVLPTPSHISQASFGQLANADVDTNVGAPAVARSMTMSRLGKASNLSPVTNRYIATDTPLSPTLSSRQSSIRRLFSRSTLNISHADDYVAFSQPSSAGPGPVFDDRKAKRNSRWFRRVRSTELSNQSARPLSNSPNPISSTSPTSTSRPSGPPPPVIPELAELETSASAQSDWSHDLFAKIE